MEAAATPASTSGTETDPKDEQETTKGGFQIQSLLKETHPTDRDRYPADLADPELKSSIIKLGPSQPEGLFPRTNITCITLKNQKS